MAHVAPTSHRRATRASHRGHRTADGPIHRSTWLGLTFAFVLGMVLTAQSHVGVHAAGVTLQVMLVPVTIGVIGSALRRGFGSFAALTTAAALAFVLLRFFL